jgi:uncharacterized membrane protein
VPAAHCSLNSWSIDINLQEGDTTDWVVSLNYDENVTRSDYYVLAKISSFEVYADGEPIQCSATEVGLGTSILCQNINTNNIEYRFKAMDLISVRNELRIFKYKFPITQLTNNFTVTVKLPLGSFFADPSKLKDTGLLPYEPGFGEQGSDGRRIFVKWYLDKPKVGDSIDASVIYEQVIASYVLITVGAGVLILVIAAMMFLTRKRGIRNILPVLTDVERNVMEIVLREKKVDQREIIKECDFSKSKISRIIHDLEKRGLISRSRIGRRNQITLKKEEIKEK